MKKLTFFLLASIVVVPVLVTATETETMKYSMSLRGEFNGSPYFNMECNKLPWENYSLGLTFSKVKWEETFNDPPPSEEVKINLFMLGGRIIKWLPQWNDEISLGPMSSGFLKPYLALEINRHKTTSKYWDGVVWQKDLYGGVELLLPSQLAILVEAGIGHVDDKGTGKGGLGFTYNFGCKRYTNFSFLKRWRWLE